MSSDSKHDSWSEGAAYDHYMGRWSHHISYEFIDWLNVPRSMDWIDVGCGTGALAQVVLDSRFPKSVIGIDPSEGFVSYAQENVPDDCAQFIVGNAEALPIEDHSVDVATSALVLNFVPNKIKMLQEMQRVTRKGGMVAFYVWDYPGGGMGFIDAFWSAAIKIDPGAQELDESKRFPFCTVDGIAEICLSAGLVKPEIKFIEVETEFPNFEAFWHPFTLGAGPAPGYCMDLSGLKRERLKNQLIQDLGSEGPIVLPARALAVKVGP